MNYGFVMKKMLFVAPVVLGAALAVGVVNATSEGSLCGMFGAGDKGVHAASDGDCGDKDKGSCGALSFASLSLAAKEDCGDKDKGRCGAAPAALTMAAKEDCEDKGSCGAVKPAVALGSISSFLTTAEKEDCGAVTPAVDTSSKDEAPTRVAQN